MGRRFCKNCFERIIGIKCQKCGCNNEFGKIKQVYLPPGILIADKYMTGKLLGHGGFGATYLGDDLAGNKSGNKRISDQRHDIEKNR